jgi:hypothetical protein
MRPEIYENFSPIYFGGLLIWYYFAGGTEENNRKIGTESFQS